MENVKSLSHSFLTIWGKIFGLEHTSAITENDGLAPSVHHDRSLIQGLLQLLLFDKGINSL